MDKIRQELAERLAAKKAGVRGFPAIENEVNLGYVTEEERDMIVAALRPVCQHCASEAEPGWIETDNNGPIVPCGICNGTGVRGSHE